MLPLEWWKLSYYWLSNLKSRSPVGRRGGLFRNSMRAASFGLALSVAALSVTVALVTGFQRTLSSAAARSLGHVVYYGAWRFEPELQKISQLAQANGLPVERIESFWSSQGLLVGPKGGRGVLIEGRNQRTLAQDTVAPLLPKDEVSISLGKPLAEYLGVKVGDSVRVLLPGVVKAPVEARVRALLSYGMYEVDSRLAVIDDATLRRHLTQYEPDTFAQRPGDAHGLRFFFKDFEVGVGTEKKVSEWKERYRLALAGPTVGEKDPVLRTWTEQKKNLFGAVETDKKILSLVLSLLTLVAALNIGATLVVLFLERDREIATLRAIGLSPGQLVQWILSQGFLLGVFSSGAGMLLGRLMAWALQAMPFAKVPEEIYNVPTLPLYFAAAEQGTIFAFGVAASILAALVLGWGLSRQNMVLVLGHRR